MAGAEQLAADLEQALKDNRKLRELLWIAHSQGGGYGDDGELQDTTRVPFIDFKRDSVDQIEAAIVERNVRAFKNLSALPIPNDLKV